MPTTGAFGFWHSVPFVSFPTPDCQNIQFVFDSIAFSSCLVEVLSLKRYCNGLTGDRHSLDNGGNLLM